jgi:peptide-methionine (R)-S-oxide reductase
MERRNLLKAIAAAPIVAFAGRAHSAPPATMKEVENLQSNWKTLLAEGTQVPSAADKLNLSKDEWRKRLEPKAFSVLREEDTERVFVCAGCGLPVFTSAMKFNSGTGWPSFFTTIPGAFATKTDYKIIYPRTEYHCARCGGHHGHVFDDGPPPTRQRFCNNGAALKFIPKSGKA